MCCPGRGRQRSCRRSGGTEAGHPLGLPDWDCRNPSRPEPALGVPPSPTKSPAVFQFPRLAAVAAAREHRSGGPVDVDSVAFVVRLVVAEREADKDFVFARPRCHCWRARPRIARVLDKRRRDGQLSLPASRRAPPDGPRKRRMRGEKHLCCCFHWSSARVRISRPAGCLPRAGGRGVTCPEPCGGRQAKGPGGGWSAKASGMGPHLPVRQNLRLPTCASDLRQELFNSLTGAEPDSYPPGPRPTTRGGPGSPLAWLRRFALRRAPSRSEGIPRQRGRIVSRLISSKYMASR